MNMMRVWLSGGAGGIGLRLAEAMLQEGCRKLAIIDIIPQEKGNELVRRLTQTDNGVGHDDDEDGLHVNYFCVDVRNAHDVEQSMRDAAAQLGGLNIVINNAGIADETDMERTMDVNANALIRATEAAFRVFGDEPQSARRDDGDGKPSRTVLNIGSAAGVFAIPDGPYYAASKHAVVGYSRSIAPAALQKGIRVLCVCPAWVDVGMGSHAVRAGRVHDGSAGVMPCHTLTQFVLAVLHSRDFAGDVFYLSERAGVTVVRTQLRKTTHFLSKL